MRGAGEKQIELDQRMLSERVKVTEQKLRDVSGAVSKIDAGEIAPVHRLCP